MNNQHNNDKTNAHSCCAPKKFSASTLVLITIGMIGVIALIFFKPGAFIYILPFLGILACPLFMYFGMKGMHDNNKNDKTSH